MIRIKKSHTADSRTCDSSQVTKETLLESSYQHIDDVKKGTDLFSRMLTVAAAKHDHDKISDIDGFHRDFSVKFKTREWLDNHFKVNRHHLLVPEGIPSDVNLIDVLDMVTDCVMAGMGRSGSVYPLKIDPQVLMDAFQNTVELLKAQIIVEQVK